MQIKNLQANTFNKVSFEAIIVPREQTRSKILSGLNEEQLNQLKILLLEQKKNPVNAVINSDKNFLQAKIFCQYRIKDFKENYHQIPFLESKLNFIKRIITKCNEYRQQLDLSNCNNKNNY